MQEQLEQLLARQNELHVRLQQAEAAVVTANAQAATAEARAEAAERATQSAPTQVAHRPLVDTRSLGKVKCFSGKREDWQSWCFTFLAFVGGANPGTLEAMKWAESCDYTIPEHPDQANREHIQHAPHAQQIYLALCLSVQDGSEAMVKLMNIQGYNGLEGWRTLKRHYEPMTRGNMRLRMDRLLRPAPADKLENVMKVIELWEKEVREYEQRYNKTFDVDVKTATLVHLAPEPVQKHVYLNEGSY
eukprot:6473720-Amphidinium_carterae.1